MNLNFKIEVYPDMYWVPAAALGGPRYTDDEINGIIPLPPGEKAGKIGTFCDAVKLYQSSGFYGYIDNVRVMEEETGIIWPFHKPGYHAVRTNGGCCAAGSNWLCYMLNGKYDEVGCFGFNLSSGDGHIINYIKHSGEYYFADMMMRRRDQLNCGCADNGDISDYKSRDFTGYIYKTADVNAFVKFFRENHPHRPVLFYLTRGECFGIGTKFIWRKTDGFWSLIAENPLRYYFKKDNTEILFAENESVYEMRTKTAVTPDWDKVNSFDFVS